MKERKNNKKNQKVLKINAFFKENFSQQIDKKKLRKTRTHNELYVADSKGKAKKKKIYRKSLAKKS